jgi:uncharacterized membrane protein (UPF0127 family)
MQKVFIHNLDRPEVTPILARYCDTFGCQLRGLTFRKRLHYDEGLLLVQSRDHRLDAAIHMLGMWMDLAVIWVNQAGKVVDVRLARRWRLAYIPAAPACYVLEAHTGRLGDFSIGERVHFEPAALA